MDFILEYKPCDPYTILVQWPSKIDEIILEDVLSFKNIIKKNNIKDILYVNHSYDSLLISYNLTIDNIYNEILTLKTLYQDRNVQKTHEKFLHKIPVCYHEKFGIDLRRISVEKSLATSEIIERHSTAIYTVFFIGFLPGFLYLGGLDKSLKTSRLKTPRMRVAKGAVGIGENQTGIYPNVSPGGWNIIGNSPIDFFDVSKPNPCVTKAGDKIQFVPITKEKHALIANNVKQGTYNIESEVYYD